MIATIDVRTNTKNFNPNKSRIKNSITRPDYYVSVITKRNNYLARAYYEYLDVQRTGGTVFFYTLTYNDKSVKSFYGRNVFNYPDLRNLLTGGFYQHFHRDLKNDFSYLITSELGEGKGKRGYANNPHYHCLFFFRFHVDPLEFLSVIRKYWQGVDVHWSDSDPQQFKYGIVEPGDNYGVVTGVGALYYVCKYVIKSASCRSNFSEIEQNLSREVFERYYRDSQNQKMFFLNNEDTSLFSNLEDSEYLDSYIKNNSYAYSQFISELSFYEISEKIKDFRNLHGCKVRISNGLGKYALENIIEKPLFDAVSIPDRKRGFKLIPLSGYLFRKRYMNYQLESRKTFQYVDGVFEEVEDKSVRYTWNHHGLNMLCRTLPHKLENLSNKIYEVSAKLSVETSYTSVIDFYQNKKEKYSFPSYEQLREKFGKFFDHFGKLSKDICYLYSRYKIIYQNRLFFPQFDNLTALDDQRNLLYFSLPSYSGLSYDHWKINDSHSIYYRTYESHSLFKPYIGLFSLLDYLVDCENRQANKDFFEKEKQIESTLNSVNQSL